MSSGKCRLLCLGLNELTMWNTFSLITWLHHDTETLCVSPATDGFPKQRDSNTELWCPFIDSLNKLPSKWSNGRSVIWDASTLTYDKSTLVQGMVCAVRQQAITWINVDPDLRRHMASLGHNHDDVIKWIHFPRYWPFVRGIRRSPVNSPHKGQWRGALMFSLTYVWINVWVNNREAGDLKRYHAHYDVTVMMNYQINLMETIDKHSVGVVRCADYLYNNRVPTATYLQFKCFIGIQKMQSMFLSLS